MKKIVVKLDVHDEKSKQKAMNKVTSLEGVDSISVDLKDKKLTVIGDIDAVRVVGKLKKLFHTELISVGPAKEEKKEEPKKAEEKKKDPKDETEVLLKPYRAYYPYVTHYHVSSAEEDPNSCTIC